MKYPMHYLITPHDTRDTISMTMAKPTPLQHYNATHYKELTCASLENTYNTQQGSTIVSQGSNRIGCLNNCQACNKANIQNLT